MEGIETIKLNSRKVAMSFRSDWREAAVFSRLICGGSPGFPLQRSGKNSGGGKFPSQISRRKDQAGSLGTKEKTSPPFFSVHFQSRDPKDEDISNGIDDFHRIDPDDAKVEDAVDPRHRG